MKKKKKKKGFTLVELLATIVILAVIMILTIPNVIVNINKSKQLAFENASNTIKKYLEDNFKNCKLGNEIIADYDEVLFKSDCTLIKENSSSLINNAGYKEDDIEKVIISTDNIGNFEIEATPNPNGVFGGATKYSTGTIPNVPELNNGLIPVVYDSNKGSETHWFVADNLNKWYDYSQQIWANAVSVKNRGNYVIGDNTFKKGIEIKKDDMLAMFVWIPRFSYTIGCDKLDNCFGYKIEGASDLKVETPGAIDIKFISTDVTDDASEPKYEYTSIDKRESEIDNWYTHPAFNFDGKKLSGIWVGKFETNVIETIPTIPTILPDELVLTNQIVDEQIITAQKFTASENIYGLTGESHLMKNSEWGAVAYLSQSKYGKYGNSSYSEVDKEVYVNNSGITNGFVSKYTGRSFGKIEKGDVLGNEFGNYKYNGMSTSKPNDFCLKCGMGASTTGNIYGIYDMSGGAYEVVDNTINSSYGMATEETKGWYGDYYIDNNNNNNKYYIRGYYFSNKDNRIGIFSFLGHDENSKNSNISFRVTLYNNN